MAAPLSGNIRDLLPKLNGEISPECQTYLTNVAKDLERVEEAYRQEMRCGEDTSIFKKIGAQLKAGVNALLPKPNPVTKAY